MPSQLFNNKGLLSLESTPIPTLRSGEILIRSRFSAFSSGTEFAELAKSSQSLLSKAKSSPQKIQKAIEMVKSSGLKNTLNFIDDTQYALFATGYSVAGEVISVGPDVYDISPGQLVAAAGAQCAHHAEYVCVPRNLCCPVPQGLPLHLASTVTLGSIALQAVRQSKLEICERVAVIGLGLIGQFLLNILKANGSIIAGFDISEDKVRFCQSLGFDNCFNCSSIDPLARSKELTSGHLFDKVFICSSDPTPSSIQLAFDIARKRASVVMVGQVNLNLDRRTMYYKELKFIASMSYGPGRYERSYEELGYDMPLPFVRWSENRNMEAFLNILLACPSNFDKLVGKVLPLPDAPVFLNSDEAKSLLPPLILLEYPDSQPTSKLSNYYTPTSTSSRVPSSSNKLSVALIGAGAFPRQFILPHLKTHKSLFLHSVVSHDQTALTNIKRKYLFQNTCSSPDSLDFSDLNACFVSTRHSTHLDYIKLLSNNDQHIYIDKPPINDPQHFEEFTDLINQHLAKGLVFHTGFNRFFSPHFTFARNFISSSRTNSVLVYQLNAGLLKPSNWQYDPGEYGRNIGEAIHIYHFSCALFNSAPSSVTVSQILPSPPHSSYDNFVVNIQFESGDLASIIYTSLGSKSFPKESYNIHSGSDTLHCNDYITSTLSSGKVFSTRIQDKGFKANIDSFIDAVNGNATMLDISHQLSSIRIAFQVESFLRGY